MRRLLIVNVTCILCACASGTEIQAEEALLQTNDSKTKSEVNNKNETIKFGFQNIFKRYVNSAGAKATVTKKIHLELLDEDKTSEGVILFANGLLRVEIADPDASTIILNREAIWIIVPENKDLGSKTQVTKIVSNKDQKRSRAPLALLLTDNDAWTLFKLKTEKKMSSEIMESTLIPTNKDLIPEVALLKIKYDITKQEIKDISYSDDIGNKTSFEFKSSSFNNTHNKKLFDYKPTKNDEVTVFK